MYGLADGKIKLGMLKTNKTYSMYSHPEGSYVVSLAASSSGNAIISGHLDGSIYKFTFPEQEGGQGLGHSKLLQHSCTPYALAWGDSICIAGNDNRVSLPAAIAPTSCHSQQQFLEHEICRLVQQQRAAAT